MPLDPRSRVGAYEIVSSLGAGGMGEVYRARDSRLNREVALKVLPDIFAADPERLARFEREAQALAALRHPHIATIYGIEEKDSVRALVLELVEGDTLEERIKQGALPVDEAARLARQIADALEAAHEQGIVHRDLKPANIKVTPDGDVKVLDFGLAKLGEPGGASEAGAPALSLSPTMTSPALMTGMHVLLGTAGYMAPEQARGKTADKRADIWAFGVVLYEMLTGSRAFEGETVTEVAGAVIHKNIDLATLPPNTPPLIRMVIGRCLQKDPKQRFRDMGDVRLALDGAFTTASASTAQPPNTRARTSWIPLAAASLIAALLAGAAVWALNRSEPVRRESVRFEIPPPAPRSLSPLIDISRDGRMVSFVAADGDGNPKLWVRPLDSPQARTLNPMETTRGLTFWSPDGRYVAMFAGGRLRRVPVDGGPVETIATLTGDFLGGSWGRDGTIVISNQQAVVKVPAAGGEPVPVTLYDEKQQTGADFLPWFLPDGRHFLYLKMAGDERRTGIYVGSIDLEPEEQSQTRIVAAQHNAAYVPAADGGPGRLLFLRDGLLMAQPFDERTLTVAGEATPAAHERIMTNSVLASFAVSSNGTLIYMRSAASAPKVASFDRTGKAEPLLGDAKLERVANPRLSADGRRLALMVEGQVWAYDLGGRPPIKLTFDGEHYSPLWTPDGERIVFEKGGGETRSLFSVRANGSGMPEAIGPEGHFHPFGWAADGRMVAAERTADGSWRLVRFSTATDAEVEVVAANTVPSAAVSPDGRWVAYSADATGRNEIWVRPLAGDGAAVRVSPNGGGEPVWSKNSRELYYLEGNKVMAVPVTMTQEFNFGAPVTLFTAETLVNSQQPPSYDVTADGRFVTLAAEEAPDIPISVILNWTESGGGGPASH